MNNYYINELENYLNTYGVQDKDAAEFTRENNSHKNRNAKINNLPSFSTLPETIKANREEKRNVDLYLRDRKRAIKTLRKSSNGSHLTEDQIFSQMIGSYIRSKIFGL